METIGRVYRRAGRVHEVHELSSTNSIVPVRMIPGPKLYRP